VTQDVNIGSAETTASPKRWGGGRVGSAVVLALGVAAVVAGVLYLRAAKSVEATDNAYVKTDLIAVGSRVRGLVSDVMVRPDQPVRAGAPLVQIAPDEYDARLAVARADEAQAEAAIKTAKAALEQFDAELAARKQVAAASLASGAANLAQLGNAQLAAVQRRVLAASLDQARAGRAKADAELTLADQDRGHTLIVAPADGIVGDLSVHAGELVQPGSRILTLVAPVGAYVVANFKETQIARMRVGQPAQIRLDALPDVRLTGEVASLAPASGAEFALLPFEPGSGNFTKIVQRIPVRIHLDPSPDVRLLKAGLSARVSVRLSN
jgi:membrane fusion protein (multidrug efflux system)